jgi:hypothetical protein
MTPWRGKVSPTGAEIAVQRVVQTGGADGRMHAANGVGRLR